MFGIGVAQLGYMVGALAGGAVLAVGDFGALGFFLLGGIFLSALLVTRVDEPGVQASPVGSPLVAPVQAAPELKQ